MITHPIQGKTILLGVTGSIAAYKGADLASKLAQAGGLVDVILTEAALKFITPLTFQSVTGRKVFTDADLWGGEGHVTHIGLGQAGDLMVIAPASANTIAKLANGIADNLLSVAALAARCPILIAPAMDAGMFSHPATQANVASLRQRGVTFVGPAAGHLASGLVGVGRMTEPLEIVGEVRRLLARSGPLSGKKVVVTAGGTQEAVDPVRYLTNRSSGKQGYAVAQAAVDSGAEVILITTPTHLEPPVGVRLVQARSAAEMLTAVLQESANADLLIMAAAVADFRPASASNDKIKKSSLYSSIPLTQTEDILSAVAVRRVSIGFPRHTIGFAAETRDLLENARGKLAAKHLDLIVANDVGATDAGFEVETNRAVLLFADGRQETLPLQSKMELADHILGEAATWF